MACTDLLPAWSPGSPPWCCKCGSSMLLVAATAAAFWRSERTGTTILEEDEGPAPPLLLPPCPGCDCAGAIGIWDAWPPGVKTNLPPCVCICVCCCSCIAVLLGEGCVG
eukprot:156885-Pelagomonas_calceolata.AAC.2